MANPENSNSTLFRGLNILRLIADSPRGMTISELVQITGIPKPTAHRICMQFESQGYLQRSPMDKRFIVGGKFKELALTVISNASVGAPRHAILQALSEEIGETCNCTMLDGHHTVYFDRVECNWPIKIDLHPGSRLPMHATASGKLFLAFMAPRDRRKLLQAAPLTRNTDRTIVSPELLEEQLKEIKKEGVGYDNEEFLQGMVAIAVPVFNKENRVCFTVAAHAPTTRKSLDDLRQYIPSLRRAAAALASSYCDSEDIG